MKQTIIEFYVVRFIVMATKVMATVCATMPTPSATRELNHLYQKTGDQFHQNEFVFFIIAKL